MKKEEATDFARFHTEGIQLSIISFLPIKDAVATSALAKPWRYMWKFISPTQLEFNDITTHRNPTPHPNRTLFINFLNNILENAEWAGVDSISLSCHESYGSNIINAWLRKACKRCTNLVQLKIYSKIDPIRLPRGIFISTSLVVLKLHANVNLDLDRYDPCFPRLKVLQIFVQNKKVFVLTTSDSCCPVLEDLYLQSLMVQQSDPVLFNISSSSLKRLRIELTSVEKFSYFYDYSFSITAPNLEWVDISNNLIVGYRFRKVGIVGRVIVHIGLPSVSNEILQVYGYDNRAFELFLGLSEVQSLRLSGSTMCVLSYLFQNKDDMTGYEVNVGRHQTARFGTFPTFSSLRNLELGFRSYSSLTILPYILQSSPNLEGLVLEKEIVDEVQFVCDYWKWSEPAADSQTKSMSCLKKICVKGFQLKQIELTVLKYFLRNGHALKEITISYPPLALQEEMELHETICQLPRVSQFCKVLFETKMSTSTSCSHK